MTQVPQMFAYDSTCGSLCHFGYLNWLLKLACWKRMTDVPQMFPHAAGIHRRSMRHRPLSERTKLKLLPQQKLYSCVWLYHAPKNSRIKFFTWWNTQTWNQQTYDGTVLTWWQRGQLKRTATNLHYIPKWKFQSWQMVCAHIDVLCHMWCQLLTAIGWHCSLPCRTFYGAEAPVCLDQSAVFFATWSATSFVKKTRNLCLQTRILRGLQHNWVSPHTTLSPATTRVWSRKDCHWNFLQSRWDNGHQRHGTRPVLCESSKYFESFLFRQLCSAYLCSHATDLFRQCCIWRTRTAHSGWTSSAQPRNINNVWGVQQGKQRVSCFSASLSNSSCGTQLICVFKVSDVLVCTLVSGVSCCSCQMEQPDYAAPLSWTTVWITHKLSRIRFRKTMPAQCR